MRLCSCMWLVVVLCALVSCAFVPNASDAVRDAARAAQKEAPRPERDAQASPAAAAVAGDAVLLARLGGAVAVLGLALSVGFRSRALLYVSAAGAVAVVGAVAMGQVMPWLPLASLIGVVGGVVTALVYLVRHHKGEAAAASSMLDRVRAWGTTEAAALVGQVVPGPAPAPGTPAGPG